MLQARYTEMLAKLSRQKDLIGTIFMKAQNSIQDAAKLRRLVSLIDSETWYALGVDTKNPFGNWVAVWVGP